MKEYLDTIRAIRWAKPPLQLRLTVRMRCPVVIASRIITQAVLGLQ
jgi:hypothetical protein